MDFIGANLCEYLCKKYPDIPILNVSKHTYAVQPKMIRFLDKYPNYRYVPLDIFDCFNVMNVLKDNNVVRIYHLAAESIPEDVLIPIKNSKKIQMVSFGKLWKQIKRQVPVEKTEIGERMILKGKQTKALSFLNGGQWIPITAITRHYYNGNIVTLKQKHGIISATPNHSVYSANLELVSPTINPELLRIRNINDRKEKYLSIDKGLLLLYIAYITEGNTTFNKANGGYITEISQDDEKWLEILKNEVKRLFKINGWIIEHKKEGFASCYSLQFSNKELFYFLRKKCGWYSHNKFLPDEVFNVSPELKHYVWEQMLFCDGTNDGRYTTTSFKLANQIGLLLALMNKQFTVFERINKPLKTSWEIKTESKGQHTGLTKKQIENTSYSGWVYDIEVEGTRNFSCGLGNIVCHNSHVDRSFQYPRDFIMSNIEGTFSLLEACRTMRKMPKFFYMGTDEVFGSVKQGFRTEEHMPHPENPYAATKVAAEALCQAWMASFKIPVVIARSMNVYGPLQHAEKLVPKIITNILSGKEYSLYKGNSMRGWSFVYDTVEAIDKIMVSGKNGEVYHIPQCGMKGVYDINEFLLQLMPQGQKLFKGYINKRLKDDDRYAISGTKMQFELGWMPKHTWEEGMKLTVEWYDKNRELWM